MIIRQKNKWVLYSRDKSKILGYFKTKKQAEKHEREIQFFKHQN